MNQTILRTEGLKAFYVLDVHGTQKVVKAVNEVDIEILENEVYGIAGESGCGKTTLLKTLVASIEPPLRLIEGKVYYRVTGLEEVEITTIGPRSDAEEDRWWTDGEFDVPYVSGGAPGIFDDQAIHIGFVIITGKDLSRTCRCFPTDDASHILAIIDGLVTTRP